MAQSRPKAHIGLDFLWLVAGCGSLLFMGGKWNIPILTWVGSIFFLRYFRMQRRWWGVLGAFPFILVASRLFFVGLAEQVTVEFQILIATSYTLYVMIPCLQSSRQFIHRMHSLRRIVPVGSQAPSQSASQSPHWGQVSQFFPTRKRAYFPRIP